MKKLYLICMLTLSSCSTNDMLIVSSDTTNEVDDISSTNITDDFEIKFDIASNLDFNIGYCGNNKIDYNEDCDNDNFLCINCKKAYQVFVTSESYQGFSMQEVGNENFDNGLMLADGHCIDLAFKANLLNFHKFKAWLSDDNLSVIDRFEKHDSNYVLIDGTIVAENWNHLVTKDLFHPIDLDENGIKQTTRAWTGTFKDGSSSGFNCNNWNDKSGVLLYGSEGRIITINDWSYYEEGGCYSENRLYCFEQ